MAKGQLAYINVELLSWARNLDDISIQEAAKSSGVTPDKVVAWENGVKLPTVRQAKELAKKYRIPYVYFYLSRIPVNIKRPKSTDFRTLKNLALIEPSRELNFLLRDILERRDVLIELYKELEYKLTSFKYKINLNDNKKNIVEYIRSILGLNFKKQNSFRTPEKAYNYYREAFESLGILIFQAAGIQTEEMRGISVYEEIFPIIVVNRKDSINARIFTLFHEFVHILTNTPGICNDMTSFSDKTFSTDIEIFCNDIAAQTLVPSEYLGKFYSFSELKINGFDDNLVKELAKEFVVSREVIIGRLFELNIIPIALYLKKLDQYTNEFINIKKQRKKDGGFLSPGKNIVTQVGKMYAKTILSAYNQELITARLASGYLSGIRLQHFPQIESMCF